MKRRDFLVASVGTAGAMVPLLGRAAQPCPPEEVSAAGGSTSTTPCVAAAGGSAGSYTTTFPNTENPLSEGGIWTLGGTHGLDWQDIRTTGGSPGTAYGVGPSATSPTVLYNDCIAALQGRFNPQKHFAECLIRRDSGYSPSNSHEVELYVGLTIGPHSARGYEMDFTPYGGPVRWNGPAADFNDKVFTTLSGGPFTVANGDVLRAEFDSTSGSPVMSLFLNGTLKYKFVDSTSGKITSGNPGMGSFARQFSGLDMSKFAIRRWSGGSL